jgi:dTDP-4-dehydrorhamnose reductase
MSYIYIIGENSFIGKNLYLVLKKYHNNIILLNHNEIHTLKNIINNNDTIINVCGINRASSQPEYDDGNYEFIKKLIEIINAEPFIIHLSSLMVYGFKNKNIDDLTNYQKWFIMSKLKGEHYLINNYSKDKLTIIRPSNIYGYNCTPYYNNLLSTLVYEKINNLNKVSNVNINCVRNFLSIEKLCETIKDIIITKKTGTYNILSNNNINLKNVLSFIYDDNIPKHFILHNGEHDIIDLYNDAINNDAINNDAINIIIDENIINEVKQLEQKMKIFLELKNNIQHIKLEKLSQSRGDMIEISNLASKRMYKITLTKNAIRGNHYHYEQTEEFFNNKGFVTYLLAFSHEPNIIYMFKAYENDLIKIKPLIIHTLTNDYLNNIPEIIVTSTQEYILNSIPDTKYVNIV